MATVDQVPERERLSVSATLYTTWRRCPQQALARVQGVYPAPSRASFKGALAHRLFARHLDEGPIGEDDFALVCRQETGANLGGQLAEVGLRPSEFRSVVAEVAELYERFTSFPGEGFREAEASFEAELAENVGLRGRVDAVFEDEDGLRIVDWKTGAVLDETTEAQLGFYAMAWDKVTGTPPKASEAVSLVTGERVSISVDPASIAAIEEDVAKMVHQLRAAMESGGELERVAGPYCRWCPLLDECGEGVSAVALLDHRS